MDPCLEQLSLRRMVLAVLAALLVAVAGCGHSPAGEQARVRGAVSHNGQPLPLGWSVVFFCHENGVTAAGRLDSLGRFVLTPADAARGIPSGRYQVTVRPPEPPPIHPGSAEYARMMGQGGDPLPPKAAQKSSAIALSGLELELAVGDNEFKLDVGQTPGVASAAVMPALR